MISRAAVVALAALPLAFTIAARAAVPWTVVAGQSRISFTATWLGKPVPGSFRRWTATIDFDPARPTAARIVVDIDTASAVTGDRTVDGALPDADWFGTGRAAVARFVVESVTATGPGAYVARGTLAVKGKAVPVVLPFTLGITGGTATMAGGLTFDRRSLGLGLTADTAGDYVAFAVPVKITVVAKRPGAVIK